MRLLRQILCLLLFCLLCLAPAALAEQNATGSAGSASPGNPKAAKAVEKPAEKPAAAEKKNDASDARVPVYVDYDGDDPMGQRLVFELKELFRTSAGFRLAKAGEKQVRIRLTAQVEFKDRPNLGSVYGAVWMFSEGGDVLSYYLDSAVGVVDEVILKREVQSLASRTDKLAGRFSYLFE